MTTTIVSRRARLWLVAAGLVLVPLVCVGALQATAHAATAVPIPVTILCTKVHHDVLGVDVYDYSISNESARAEWIELFGLRPALGNASAPLGWVALSEYQVGRSVAWAAVGTDTTHPVGLEFLRKPSSAAIGRHHGATGFRIAGSGRSLDAAVHVERFLSPPIADEDEPGPFDPPDPALWELPASGNTTVPEFASDSAVSTGAPLVTTRPIAISVSSTKASRIQLDVVDAAGATVRRLLDARGVRQGRRLEWNTTDEAGHAVPDGTYRIRLRVNGEHRVEREIVVRR